VIARAAATGLRRDSPTDTQHGGERMSERFDAIVIGAGQAGPALCARLDAQGLRTALIERNRVGGTCVNTGCIPTKTMIASARVAWLARRAADYGVVSTSAPRVDMRLVIARKDAIVAEFVDRLGTWIGGMKNVSFIRGHGRFAAPHRIAVNERVLEAPWIFINVGARPQVPDLPGVKDVAFLTSSSMLRLEIAPPHLVVVGGGYVGLEFAQMFRRFGSKLTVVEKSARLAPREDADISMEIRAILEAEGIEIRAFAECISLQKASEGIAVGLACKEGPPVATGTHVLLAVGRAPNTHDLGLEQAGIRTDDRGYIAVDDQLRTNVEGVWALGEVNGRGAFTHTAWNDHEIVAANLFDGESRRVTDRIATYALFTDPPLGRAGMGESQARASGRKILVASLPFSHIGRARAIGETQGFMKAFVDAATGEILGATVLGAAGDEVVQGLLDAMYAKAPCTTLQRAMHIHPTVAEYIPTLLGDLKPLQ
jgi:pyruvate/2-oxoglutarate dehydrogenase complex dihydrolipoamide dehydrogenase (E3) component